MDGRLPSSGANQTRILIVEDDQPVANNLVRGLQALGWSVCVAGSAAEALSLLEDAPDITVMVTDIRMPNGTGLELAEAMMQNRADDVATEVVIITGHASTQDVTTAMRLGACDFLHKPFRLAAVERAIRKANERALARRAATQAKREGQVAAARLACELDSLRRQLQDMRSMLRIGHEGSEAEWEKATRAISQALRTPLNDFFNGADLTADGAPWAENLDLLRAGVQRAVSAIELLEEFNRPPGGPPASWGKFDFSSVVTEVADALALREGVHLAPRRRDQARQLAIMANRIQLRRAVTFCFEAALEWAPVGALITHDLECLPDPAAPRARLVIFVGPEDPAALASLRADLEEGPGVPEDIAEALRLLLAQRLLALSGGALAVSRRADGTGAIGITLPLCGAL